ncbi:hypothetical protein R69746_04048 [Paraburkholderia aspalathi]|nr:hypothetical protein R69746_04048 [Paraburkholderia aspalathi]
MFRVPVFTDQAEFDRATRVEHREAARAYRFEQGVRLPFGDREDHQLRLIRQFEEARCVPCARVADATTVAP